MKTVKCKNCGKEFITKDKRRLFCSVSCATSFNNTGRVVKESTKEKLKVTGAKSAKNRYKKEINSILDLSKRTVTKILKRLNVGCSNCGWDRTTCDIHHINGRKIDSPDNHSNLVLLCPNCHRLAHENKLKDFKSLDIYLPNDWKDKYYG